MTSPHNFAHIPPPSPSFVYNAAPSLMRHVQQQRQPLQTFSDEDMSEPGQSTAKLPRRGTRACDRCRKIKSKCEGTEGDRCKNCIAAGSPCTFQGPSYKRGPPKGYIHAIEQRWHQVECVLATIMALPGAQDIIADMRTDTFARDILNRVETGPYGSVGRSSARTMLPGEDGFYNTIMNQSNAEDRRSKRQSRQSRELVSNQDSSSSTVPTAEWQQQLYRRLAAAKGSGLASPATPYSTASSSDRARFPSYSSSSSHPSPVAIVTNTPGYSSQPSRRRKLESSVASSTSESNHDILPRSRESRDSVPEGEEYDEATDAFGHLSVDQNHEFRYHGRSAGLHLLAKSDRRDDSQQRENGIWKFNMPKLEAGCNCLSFDKVNSDIDLPNFPTQDQLIMAYFSYVHHAFPVIHKASFLAMYNERTLDTPGKAMRGHTSREPMQVVTKLLLLAMFAFAANYLPAPDGKKPYEAGNVYALDARRLLNTLYEDSRPSVCQALLLLGMREFGIGSLSQGWMYIGMGCRMAIDLGMNRDPDNWKDSKGRDLFSPIEKQIRKQIWGSCCIADKISSVWLGRPVMFRKSDFSTRESDFDPNDDEEFWHPYPRDCLGPDFTPMAARVMGCFREQMKLSLIISEIMANLYPVKLFEDVTHQRRWRGEFENRLHQWMINLPDELLYHEAVDKPPVAPHVIILHIEYHAAMLLLHRAFLPNWNDHQRLSNAKDQDVSHNQCLNVCQAAATRISSLIGTYDATFSLARAPPFIISYIQSAGIMHVVTLTRRPRDTQATIGLLQSIRAAELLEDIWPEAIRTRKLLKGVRVDMDDSVSLGQSSESRQKRGFDEVQGEDDRRDILLQYGLRSLPAEIPASPSASQLQPSNTPYTMFAAERIQSPPPSAISYIPSYDWWPQLIGPGSNTGYDAQDYRAFQPSLFGSQLVPPQGFFTFDHNQLTSDFMQDVSGGEAATHPVQRQQQPGAQSNLPGPSRHDQHDPNLPYGHAYPTR